MARAATKSELLLAAQERLDQMWKLADSMGEEERGAAFDFSGRSKLTEAHWGRDRNLRDVFVHLYEWHQLLLRWVDANRKGDPQPFLPAPYNWKNYGEMNEGFWERHQSTPCARAEEMLRESHREVMDLIERFSDEELFEKRHFAWTGTTSLGSYCVSVTASHYDWALKKIKLHRKIWREAHPA